MITKFKIFENNNKKYSFTINDLIKYFNEENNFFDKTHKFLRKYILNKPISLSPYHSKDNILIDLKDYKFLGLDEYIIQLEYDIPTDLIKILDEIEIMKNIKKYNV